MLGVEMLVDRTILQWNNVLQVLCLSTADLPVTSTVYSSGQSTVHSNGQTITYRLSMPSRCQVSHFTRQISRKCPTSPAHLLCVVLIKLIQIVRDQHVMMSLWNFYEITAMKKCTNLVANHVFSEHNNNCASTQDSVIINLDYFTSH